MQGKEHMLDEVQLSSRLPSPHLLSFSLLHLFTFVVLHLFPFLFPRARAHTHTGDGRMSMRKLFQRANSSGCIARY